MLKVVLLGLAGRLFAVVSVVKVDRVKSWHLGRSSRAPT